MTAFPVIVGLSSTLVFVVLLFKLVQRNRALRSESFPLAPAGTVLDGWSEEWFEEFSSFRYLPMRRLLSQEEESFWLASTDSSELQRSAFRAERRRLFRQYLSLIAADFNRLSQGVRLSVVHAAEDQAAAIDQLLRLEWTFRKLLWRAHLSLMFHWLGLRPVDATQLINALQGFEFSLREVRLASVSA